jgi:uncharacterized membrane protein
MRELRLTAPLPILCASLAAAGAVLAGAGGPLRAALGIALVLVLPGAALVALLGLRLALPGTLLAVCACSISVSILVGLALGAAHAGFGADEWAAAVAGVSVLASAGALARGRGHRAPGAGHSPLGQLARSTPALAVFAAAAVIAALAVVLAHQSAADRVSSGVGSIERRASERAPLSRRAANAYLLELSARRAQATTRAHAAARTRRATPQAKRHRGAPR